MKTKVNYFNF